MVSKTSLSLTCWRGADLCIIRCFVGFLLSLIWLGNGHFSVATISKWMIYIWFGLDGSGIHYSAQFHQLLGPSLMVAFAFLGNTLFLTILVSMLSTTFSTVLANAPAEIQFRRAVLTLEGVKGDAIFAYQPPFNILAFLILIPLKFCASPRWFHKIHVTSVRLLNLPLLLIIAVAERRVLQPNTVGGVPLAPVPSFAKQYKPPRKGPPRFWEKWIITSHSDISTVFEVPPPDSLLNQITTDDELTRHLIRKTFVARGVNSYVAAVAASSTQGTGTNTPAEGGTGKKQQQSGGGGPPPGKSLSRRDSITPFPGLKAEIQGLLSESDEMTDITARLEALEESNRRIEGLLMRLVDAKDGGRTSRSSSSIRGSDVDGEDEVYDPGSSLLGVDG